MVGRTGHPLGRLPIRAKLGRFGRKRVSAAEGCLFIIAGVISLRQNQDREFEENQPRAGLSGHFTSAIVFFWTP